ncbi:hypothetical protein MMC25_004362 [Agyrium rufum]|nr:hypothetical protein [Agyrium rufum]
MSRFYFNDSNSSSSSSSIDESTLPFPQPLPRSAFLAPEFSPEAFLATLHNRHQTLEDLRSDLRTRSQELNKELLDLVNDNYQEFLTLGSRLKGGDEKIEEVRLGVLGFRGDVEGLKDKVRERKDEVEGLVEERRRIGVQMRTGRRLLEVGERVEELERKLMVVGGGPITGKKTNVGTSAAEEGMEDDQELDGDLDLSSSNEDDSEEEEDDDLEGNAIPIGRLTRRVEQYNDINRLIDKIGPEHPFLVSLEERIIRIRQTLLLDLRTALGAKGEWKKRDKERMLKVVKLYGDMGEADEALRVLQTGR